MPYRSRRYIYSGLISNDAVNGRHQSSLCCTLMPSATQTNTSYNSCKAHKRDTHMQESFEMVDTQIIMEKCYSPITVFT